MTNDTKTARNPTSAAELGWVEGSGEPVAVPPSSSRKRLEYLDGLRGLAALSVVWFHYVLVQRSADFGAVGTSIIRALSEQLDLGKFGVVLFFAISGFIIPTSLRQKDERPVRRFLISRFFRLYPLFWFATFICVPVLPADFHLTMREAALNVTMIEGFLGARDINGAAWTLEIELVFYAVCLALFIKGTLKKPTTQFLAFAALLISALVLAVLRYVLSKKLPVALPLGLSVMFIGGLWRSTVLDHDLTARRLVRWAVAGLLIAIPIIAELAYSRDYGYNEHPLPYIISYSAGVTCFLVCTTKLRLRSPWIVHMGTISYSIYLIHTPVMIGVMAMGLVPGGTVSPWVQWVWIAGMVGLAVAAGQVTYLCIERPFIAVGRRLIARPTTPLREPVAPVY